MFLFFILLALMKPMMIIIILFDLLFSLCLNPIILKIFFLFEMIDFNWQMFVINHLSYYIIYLMFILLLTLF